MTCVVILFVLAATTILTWLALSMSEKDMGPAVHHQPLGLMAARVYSQLFALA